MEPFVACVLPSLIYSVLAPVVGIGLLWRATARCSLIALLLMTVVQIVDHGLRPWHYPVGPFDALAIDAPARLAALFTLAILDER